MNPDYFCLCCAGWGWSFDAEEPTHDGAQAATDPQPAETPAAIDPGQGVTTDPPPDGTTGQGTDMAWNRDHGGQSG